MPVQLYETLFLLDPSKVASDGDAIRGHLVANIEKHGGHVEVTRPWDDRKLTYPIRNQKKGSFHIIYYKFESTKQHELEIDFKLDENILRYLTVKIEPKWETEIMTVAKNEHGAAFALKGMKEDAPMPGDGPSPPMGMDGGERRRPRRDDKPE
jgi:small subunit ribosomal protein S6